MEHRLLQREDLLEVWRVFKRNETLKTQYTSKWNDVYFVCLFTAFRGDNFQHKMSTHHLLVRKTVLPFEIPHQSSSSRSRHDEFSCWVTTQNSPTNTASFDRSNEVWRHLTCGVIVWWCNSVRWPEFKVTKRTGNRPKKSNHLLEKLFKIRYLCTNVKFIFGLISKFHLTLTVLRFSSF